MLRRIQSTAVLLSTLVIAAGARAAPDERAGTEGDTPCTDSPEACGGRQAFEAGVAAYRQERWDEACREFERALAYRWHPAIALNLALAEAKAGRYLESIEVLERIEASAEATPELIRKAETERRRATEALGHVEIDTHRAPPGLAVAIDGRALDGETSVDVNPGTHEVTVSGPDRPSVTQEVTVASGERVRLDVTPARELVVSVPGGETAEQPEPEPEPEPEPAARDQGTSVRRVDPIWFYVAAGITAAAAGVTVWSGLDTSAAYDAYKKDLPGLTQAQADRRVSNGHDLERRTNVLIGVTAAAAIGTAVLGGVFVRWQSPSGRTIALSPGLGGAAVRGTF